MNNFGTSGMGSTNKMEKKGEDYEEIIIPESYLNYSKLKDRLDSYRVRLNEWETVLSQMDDHDQEKEKIAANITDTKYKMFILEYVLKHHSAYMHVLAREYGAIDPASNAIDQGFKDAFDVIADLIETGGKNLGGGMGALKE